MLAPCYLCEGSTEYKGESCVVCGGDGEVDLNVADHIAYTVSLIHNKVGQIEDKVNAQDTKLDTLDAHLDTIEAKIDALAP